MKYHANLKNDTLEQKYLTEEDVQVVFFSENYQVIK